MTNIDITNKLVMHPTRTFLMLVLLLSGTMCFSQKKITTAGFSLSLNNTGQLSFLSLNGPSSENYLVKDSASHLLQLYSRDQLYAPVSATFNKTGVIFQYEGNRSATVSIIPAKNYIRFTLTRISGEAEAVVWGPYHLTVKDSIGVNTGVIRNGQVAIGMQALNTKTTGGALRNAEGTLEGRGTAAAVNGDGAVLQAFSIDRTKDRKIAVWSRWKDIPVKGIPEGTLTGSSIALFASGSSGVLPVIAEIELGEKLPHPLYNKQWIKQSPYPGLPYMITSFSEDNIDTALYYAKRMGLAGVYHEDPFVKWGHFELNPTLFPNGIKGFASCVKKAHAMGLRLGFHTLSNFITTNDAYVTPVPHPHLATAGYSSLAGSISGDETAIPVQDPAYFSMNSDLNSVRIGNEIIRYREVTKEVPYQLLGCVRGAFGTQKLSHAQYDTVSRLMDHPYKVFFPDWILQKEIASNIAAFINATGADQMDFDGHEGTFSTGMGNYSMATFAEEVYRQSKHPVVFGSSMPDHYFWHMNDYLNWGEPWYGGFRESQTDYRIDNQKFYELNYLPNMLGWFLVTPQTTTEDIDWMLARAAGYNAGYALVLRMETIKKNPDIATVTERIREWTEAQKKGLFTADQRNWLKDPANEVQLVRQPEGLTLVRYKKYSFIHHRKILQPGEPTSSEWNFTIPSSDDRAKIVLSAKGKTGQADNISIELDRSVRVRIPVSLEAGQSVVLDNTDSVKVFSSNGKMLLKVPVQTSLPELKEGAHHLLADAAFSDDADISLQAVIRIVDTRENLKKDQ
ncbi:MAG: hypothetical protein KF746_23720 [Chitinophagaceae bacterium]|nr:hypothetical protein [Chitinophagaceae bacterium]